MIIIIIIVIIMIIVTIIPIVTGAFGTVTKGLLQKLEDLEIRFSREVLLLLFGRVRSVIVSKKWL